MPQRPLMLCLEPRLLLAAVNPYDMGKGDWIWEMPAAMSNTGTSTVPALMAYLKNKGMKWVIVKGADGTSATFNNSQFNAQLVTDAHNAGLQIFAYQYVYGADPAGEATAAKTVLSRSGADGLVIDGESEYEHLANNAAAATTYCTSIRAAYPNIFMAHAPFPIVSYHSAFPYYTFGKYCDAVMPQDYFGDIQVTPSYMVTWQNDEWNTLYNSWKGTSKADAIKPIVPVSQGWNGTNTNFTSGADIVNFINDLKTVPNPASPGGYQGVSFWSVQHHTADMWAGIGSATIGDGTIVAPPLAPGLTIRVSGTGGVGLKAWSDSSSAAPATYVVEPEGAVGTIVSGPVFAAGYNRWEIRFKGDATTRWAAQDFVQAAFSPGVPVNASPIKGALYSSPPAALTWGDVDVATSYDVYLDGVLKGNVTGTSYTLADLTVGTHNWQVKAKNSEGVAGGPIWTFTYLPLPAAPSSPDSGNIGSVKTRPSTLNWADSANATSYDVYLDNVLKGNVTTSQWLLDEPFAPKVLHVWRVVARNASGLTSGPTWSISVDPIAGDANADGVVDIADFAALYAHYNQNGTWSQGNFNGDQRINFSDFQILEMNFGNSVPVEADPVLSGVLARPSESRAARFSLTPVRQTKLVAVHRREV